MTEEKISSTVPLDWNEVYYTNCPLVSSSNVDQELGWTREEYKKIGVEYAFLRSRRENNWYPLHPRTTDNFSVDCPADPRPRRPAPHRPARLDPRPP